MGVVATSYSLELESKGKLLANRNIQNKLTQA